MQKLFSNKIFRILCRLVFIGVLAVIGLTRIETKSGLMIDEGISYVFANGEFTAFIDPYTPEKGFEGYYEENLKDPSLITTIKNDIAFVWNLRDKNFQESVQEQTQTYAKGYAQPQWITREQFKNYTESDKLNYASTIYNIATDAHPPLYYYVLHTVSVLTHSGLSDLPGCYINLTAMLITVWIILSISENIFGNSAGYPAAALYFLSKGGYDMLLFNRMYAMAGMFAVWALYLILKRFQETPRKRDTALLLMVICLGSMTHFYFLVYAAFLMVVSGLFFLFRKNWRTVLDMIVSGIGGVLLSFLLFPFSISIILDTEGRGGEAFSNFANATASFQNYWRLLITEFSREEFVWVLLLLLVITIVIDALKKSWGKIPEIIVIGVPVLMYLGMVSKIAPYITDRYVMMIYPACAVLVAALVSAIPYSTVVAAAVVAGMLFSNQGYSLDYQRSDYSNQIKVAEEYSDYSAIYLCEGDMYSHFPEFLTYKQTLITNFDELAVRGEDPVFDSLSEVIVITEHKTDLNDIDTAMERYGMGFEKQLLKKEDLPWCTDVYLYTKRDR